MLQRDSMEIDRNRKDNKLNTYYLKDHRSQFEATEGDQKKERSLSEITKKNAL